MNLLKVPLLFSLLAMEALGVSCGPGEKVSDPAAESAAPPTVDVIKVISRKLSVTVQLPGELQPYEVVAIYPKVMSFVKWIGVDRGSRVRKGALLARLEAPELVAQRAGAQAKLQAAESQLSAARAKLEADEGTYQRLKAAAATPGVVAGNDLLIAQKAAEADRAQAKSARASVEAENQALRALSEIEAYLQVSAPFDGIVTERNVHPGALVGPAGTPGVSGPMVRIETQRRLRLVVPVPETYLAGIPEGTSVDFTVSAYPNQTFRAPIARISHAVDVSTRTMPVELDVMNPLGRLDPGSFSQVLWPVRRSYPTLFVPASAVASTLQRIFVIRVRDGKTEWVDVKSGATSGNLVEVFGDLREGEEVAVRGTDELRPGVHVTPRLASPSHN